MSREPRGETGKPVVKRPRGRPPKDKSKQPLRKVGRPRKRGLANLKGGLHVPAPHGEITAEQERIFLEAMLNAPVSQAGLAPGFATAIGCKAIGIRVAAILLHRASHPAFSAQWTAVIDARAQIRSETLKDKREEQNKVFLEVLVQTGRIETACENVGVPRAEMVRRRESDPDFKAAWAEAAELATDMLEDEAVRRGVHGYEEPVFYKGELQGVVTKYSDPLLLATLAARRADKWAKNTNLKLSGSLTLETLVNDAQKLRKRQITLDQEGNVVAQVGHDAF